jgi:gliding motility-associated peptidyl-prolyl isomerase
MKYTFPLLLVLGCTLLSCEGPEPRRPVQVKTGSFMKESAERNKQLLAEEERMIQDIISGDSTHHYLNSASGSWYYYETRVEAESPTPEPDDLVTLTYSLLNFRNDTIYSAEEIGLIRYKVDKQELFPGLRNSIKLLKEKEVGVFLLPSSLAFGYHGDNNKIGPNEPLKAVITILKIEKDEEAE